MNSICLLVCLSLTKSTEFCLLRHYYVSTLVFLLLSDGMSDESGFRLPSGTCLACLYNSLLYSMFPVITTKTKSAMGGEEGWGKWLLMVHVT